MKASIEKVATGLAALAWALSGPSMAQSAQAARTTETAPSDSLALEEVVVTAQKRAERLQDTPISITAVSGAALEAKGRGDIGEIGQMTPNLVFDTTAPVSGVSSGAVVFIRGVGQTDFQLTTDPGVGTYVDGVYVSRSVGGVLDVLDLERVEVLRGPQGTLFGRNTIGGAISLIARRPSDEFGLSGTITAGSRDRIDGRVSVNVPLSEKAAFGLVVSTKNRDGYVRGQLDDRDYGNINRESARATLFLEPSDVFTATLAVDGTRIREQNAASKLVGISLLAPGSPTRTDLIYNRGTKGVDTQLVAVPPGNPTLALLYNLVDAPAFGTAPYDGRWIAPGLGHTFATGPNGTKLDVLGGALTLELRLPFDASLKSISAFRDTSGSFNRDADGSPLGVTHTVNSNYDHEQFSQELQLTGVAVDERLKYVGGLYFFRETGNDILDVTLPRAFGRVRNYAFIENKSYAAYAQATFSLTDALGVTAGARYTDDKKQYRVPAGGGAIVNGLVGLFGPTGTVTPFFPAGTFDRSFDNWSFHGGLDYKPTDDLLLYLSYSEGFKSGGFNTRYLVPVPAVISYAPELLTTYEAGAKWEGFDRRLRINASVFHSDYNDIQLTVYEAGAPITRNGGSANINGVELEVTARPTSQLTLSGGLGYLDAQYARVPAFVPGIPADQQITKDKELANSPEWSLNARGEYRLPVSDVGELLLSADWFYSSRVENDAVNSKFLRQPGYHLVNAAIGYEHDGGRWSVTAFVDNLTNKRIIESGDSNFGIGFHEANFNRPREWGVSLKAKF